MKRLSTIFAFVAALCATSSLAQTFSETPSDIIYGQRCYKEQDGKYYAHGDKNGTGSIQWPAQNNVQVVYYLHVPQGHTRMLAYITPKSTTSVRLKVTDPESQSIIYETEVGASGTAQVALNMMDDFVFPSDKWYRFEFSSYNGSSTIRSIDKLEFFRESNLQITTPAIFMAPSTHLWTTMPSDPAAPSGQSYDWAYQEVMYPSKYERGARYIESIGVLKGYMGIQYTESGNRNVIFSMWDNGDTDKDPNLPAYLRSGLMDKDPRVTAERFGGEGTGQKTIFEHGQYYRPDTWVQFLFNARPEIVNVALTGTDGHDSIISYQNNITTAWYKMADDDDWTFISTIRASGAANYFNSFYSFLENFGDNGCEYTRAYYRNSYMRSIASGKWYNINHFNFSSTQNTSARNSRSDLGRGVTEIYPNAFYMEHGAFTTANNDSSSYAGIPLDRSCVDTIDIDAKIKRVNLSIERNNLEQTKNRLEASGEVYDLSKWEVIDFSDQEEVATPGNGLASMAIDGDASTYWQSRWKNGGVPYPHWIALKAPKPVTVSQIGLSSAKSYLYWPKTVVLHVSEDGQNWRVATDTALIEKVANSSTQLSKRVTSQYFKIEFIQSYGAMLYLNELSLSTDVSTTKIMEYAQELISNADHFDSYRTQDLAQLIEANEANDPNAVSEAINSLAQNATLLKYGGLKNNYHLSSLRRYVLHNPYGYGFLTTKDGRASVCESEMTDALDKHKGRMNVTLKENNWHIIRCEEQGYFYLYSPSLKKYIDLDGSELLSDTPQRVIPSCYSQKYFVFRGLGNKYLSLNPSAENPIQAVNELSNSCYFEVLDNYYLTPQQKEAKEIVEECEDYAKFDKYVQLAKEMLQVPQNQVGCPIGPARDRLESIYQNGNVSINSRHELYQAVDSCDCIPYDPNKYCYRLRPLSDNKYLTATSNPSIQAAALQENDPSQIWSFSPRLEGHSLSAQNTALGRMPNYSNRVLPITTTASPRDLGTYYLTQETPGTFIVSTNQHGGIALSSSNIGTSSSYNKNSSGYCLEIAKEIQISLNESGMAAINYNFDILIPQEIAVYVVDRVEDGTVYFLRVYDRLPANTAALIKAEANETLTLEISAPTPSFIERNLLSGTFFAQTSTQENIFILSASAGGTFQKSAEQTLKANSAYLALETASPTLLLNFSDEPTAIKNSVAQSQTSKTAKLYDLSGKKIATPPTKKIYIHNGKKIKKH